MTYILKVAAACATLALSPISGQAGEWSPPGPIKLMIGFGAGGGADTQARTIAQAIEDKMGWTILPEQVLGNSGLNLLSELNEEPADGTAIGMIVSETLAYNLIASPESGMQRDDFTALATTAAFQFGVVAMADGAMSNWDKIKTAAAEGTPVRFGVVTTRQADLAYHFGLGAGVDFNIVTVSGGKAIMNGLRAGDLDLGWVAGAQAPSVERGEMTNVARAISKPLKESPDAPSITELGSDFHMEGYFMFVAPGGLAPEARQALGDAIRAVLNDPETDAFKLVARGFGGATVLTDAELDAVIDREIADSKALIQSVQD